MANELDAPAALSDPARVAGLSQPAALGRAICRPRGGLRADHCRGVEVGPGE